MTIIRKELCAIRYAVSNRFTFGVPLEDIFPADDVHPQLKNLFRTICANFNYTYESKILYHILRDEHGSSVEQADIIDRLELCKDIDHYHVGLLFWATKIFLDCLPIPVLPNYTNGEFFDWMSLVKDCTKFSPNVRSKQKCVFMRIIENLLRLPTAHFVLLDYYINFLRKLSIKEGLLRQRINKKVMVILVKYYAMALFEQGVAFIQKQERNYSPLLYYLVINWKVINYFIKHRKHVPIAPLQIGNPTKCLQPIHRNTQSFKKIPLETIFDNEILEINSFDYMLDEAKTSSAFINSESQTDVKTNKRDASTQYDSDIENDVFYTPTKKSNSYEEIPLTPPKHSITDKLRCLQSSANSNLDEPYIYDDYAEQMLITTVSDDSFNLDDSADVFLSLDNTKEDIKSKMSRLGWTYTPSIDENNCPTTVNVFSPRPFTESVKNLQLCFDSDDKKNSGSNEAIKDVASKGGLRDIISSGSMRVKLEFLRILGKGRDLKVKSNSSEEVGSKIKYKKMDSTRSNMF